MDNIIKNKEQNNNSYDLIHNLIHLKNGQIKIKEIKNQNEQNNNFNKKYTNKIYPILEKENRNNFYDAFLYLILVLNEKIQINNSGYLDSNIMRYFVSKCYDYFATYNFNLLSQNDSNEFIVYFIDNFSRLIKEEDNPFFSIIQNELCCNFNHKSKTFYYESIINVEFSGSSVQNCCNSFEKLEILKEHEISRCSFCTDLYFRNQKFNKSEEYKNLLKVMKCNEKYCNLINRKDKSLLLDGKTVNLDLNPGDSIEINNDILIKYCEFCGIIFNSCCKKCDQNHSKFCVKNDSFVCKDCRSAKNCVVCGKNSRNCRFMCKSCYDQKYTVCKKTLKYSKFKNKYLLICLKSYGENVKLTREVKPSKELIFANSKFTLRSVICHSGRIEFGHYVCYIKINDDWFCFDDSHVSKLEGDIDSVKNGYSFLYEAQ